MGVIGVGAWTAPLAAADGVAGSAALAVVIRILHIAAAATVIGATVFQRVALQPSLPQLEDGARAALRDALLARWRPVVFAAIAVLLLTGLTNFMFKLGAYRGHPSVGVYHALFGIKLLAALAVFHAATVLVMPGRKFDKYRAKARFWHTYLVVLFVLIIILGAVLNAFPALFGAVATTATQPR